MDLIKSLDEICKSIGVTRISEISGYENKLIYVFQSVRPNSKHLIVDSGKGKTRNQAIISCSVEAIERFTAENYSNKIHEIAYSNIEKSLKCNILNNLKPQKISCLKGFDLYNPSKRIFLPNDLIRYKNNTANEISLRQFRSGTTGLGAHINREKALFSGIIECLERDAISSKNKKFIIDLNSIPKKFDKYIDWILKITKDFKLIHHKSNYGVMTFSTICRENAMNGGLIGMGCGFTLEEALENTLNESIQTWLMKVSGSRDDFCLANTKIHFGYEDVKSISWGKLKSYYKNKLKIDNFQSLLIYLKERNIDIFAVKLIPNKLTEPIITYKIIIPILNKLQQGNMFTGIPRSGGASI